MKTSIIFAMLACILLSGTAIKAQPEPERLNLPGDNLNLFAVMKIFQESETLELFEKTLNEQDSRVNNLDLNGDNYIDYIKVVDYVKGEVHMIIMQVAINQSENQDVAVFVVEKDRNGEVYIQLIGDEALYGKGYIIEPYYQSNKGGTPNPGYVGNNHNVVVEPVVYYEPSAWPVVRYIFMPSYVIWASPWYWGYYPTYWHPWAPWYWHEYYGYHNHWNYHDHFHHGHGHHYNGWDEHYYGPRRSSSNTVIARRDRGEFNSTYSKPEKLKDGSALFIKTHPEASSIKDKTWKIKQNNDVSGKVKTDSENAASTQPKSVKKAKPSKSPGKTDIRKKESRYSSSGNTEVKKQENKSKSSGKSEQKSEPKKSENKVKKETQKSSGSSEKGKRK